jgi:hypothetical protein
MSIASAATPSAERLQAADAPRADARARVARITSFVLLAAAIVIYLVIALHQIDLPGLYYDETLDLAPMLPVMRGEPTDLLRGIGIGRFPVMLLDYMGSLNGYLSIPFMAVLGPGYLAPRMQPIFFAVLTIVLTWVWARRWFGPGVAGVAAVLLAVDPSFVWFSRIGISVTSVMTVFSIGGLLLLEAGLRRLGARPRGHADAGGHRATMAPYLLLFAAGVLFGLGLWAKLLFLRWLIVLAAMGLVALLTARRPVEFVRATWRRLLAALAVVALGVCIGAAPLIYYNAVGLARDGQPWSIALLLGSLINPTQQFGVNNRDVWTNLGKAVDDVRVFIDGSYFWYNGVPFSNAYAMPALAIALIVGLIFAIRRGEWRRFILLPTGIGVLTFLGAFTVSGLWSTHQFIMLPLPQIMIACAAVWLAEWLLARLFPGAAQGERGLSLPEAAPSAPRPQPAILPAAVLALALLSPLIFRHVWVSAQHHAMLAQSGGSGRFSDAIYKLAGWLDANKVSQPVALDWGIEKNVRVLTGDRVRPLEIFGYAPEADEAFRQRAREALQDPERQYIVLWDRFAVYNRRQAFTEIANEMGRQVVETHIAHERSGLPVYVVLQAK